MRVKKIISNDYLHGSARARVLRNNILSIEELRKMTGAHDFQQAFRILNSAGIGAGVKPEDYETVLNRELTKAYDIVREVTNGLELFDIFRYGYDGINIKLALKSAEAGFDPLQFMTGLGTVPAEALIDGINKGGVPELPTEMEQAAEEAKAELALTGDAQKADIIVDKATVASMYRVVHEYDNDLFKKYVRSKIDMDNIRSLVRIRRMGKSAELLESTLFPGGYISTKKIAGAFSGGMPEIAALIKNSRYGTALESASESAFDGPDTDRSRLMTLEKLCDNYLLTFIGESGRFVFGVEPILGYILEKENEIRMARMIMASKAADPSGNTSYERLRAYAW